MVGARAIGSASPAGEPTAGEQRFLIEGVAWRDYVILREALDVPGLRMAYLQGVLELMSPGRRHEFAKSLIGRLVELFALEREVPLYAYGSTTFRREAKEAGAEPDECYTVGADMAEEGFPQIAIEVVVTRGGLDKLEIYRRFGVREVWFYFADEPAFQLHRLVGEVYEQAAHSDLMPSLDFTLLAEYCQRTDQPEAVREFRERIRADD